MKLKKWLIPAVLFQFWMIYRVPGGDAVEWLVSGRDLFQGFIPYRDTVMHVGPVSSLFFALLFAIFPVHILTANLSFVSLNLLTAYGLFRLCALWLEGEKPEWAALFFLVASPFFGGSELYIESLAICLGVWGFYLLYRPDTGKVSFYAAQTLFLAAFLTKQSAAIFPLAWAADLMMRQDKKAALQAISKAGLIFIPGIMLVCALFWKAQALDAFLYDFFIWNFEDPRRGHYHIILHILLGVAPWLFLLAYAGWRENVPRSIKISAVLPLLMLLKVQNHHYVLLALPFLAVLAIGGIPLVRQRTALKVVILGLAIPTVARFGFALMRPFKAPEPVAALLQKAALPIGPLGPESIFEDMRRAQEINAVVPAQAPLYTNGIIYYFYLNRRPLDRHIFHTATGREKSEYPYEKAGAVVLFRLRGHGDIAEEREWQEYLRQNFARGDWPLFSGRYDQMSILLRK